VSAMNLSFLITEILIGPADDWIPINRKIGLSNFSKASSIYEKIPAKIKPAIMATTVIVSI
jgi:hypothetical protein